MVDKKLKIDLTPLWSQPTDKFILRFLDMNETHKRKLAQRIKDVAKQRTIRKQTGPTVQTLYEALEEINPIIFGEYNQENTYRTVMGYKSFNMNVARTIAGYSFHNLCQAVYLTTCIKRRLRKKELMDIAYLTCQDWTKVGNYIDQNYIEEINQTRNLMPEEVGMDDVQRARQNAENNGANRIPQEILDEGLSDEAQEILNGFVDHGLVTDEELRTMGTRAVLMDPRTDRNDRNIRLLNENLEVVEREIRSIQQNDNPYQYGNTEWGQYEENRRQMLQELEAERLRMRERIRLERGVRVTPNQLHEYQVNILEAEPAPTDWAWTAEPMEMRVRGINPDFMVVDEVEE